MPTFRAVRIVNAAGRNAPLGERCTVKEPCGPGGLSLLKKNSTEGDLADAIGRQTPQTKFTVSFEDFVGWGNGVGK